MKGDNVLEDFEFVQGLLAALYRKGYRRFNLHRDTPDGLIGLEIGIEEASWHLVDLVKDTNVQMNFRFVTHQFWGDSAKIRAAIAFLRSIDRIEIHERYSSRRRWLELTDQVLRTHRVNPVAAPIYDELANELVRDLRKSRADRPDWRQVAPSTA